LNCKRDTQQIFELEIKHLIYTLYAHIQFVKNSVIFKTVILTPRLFGHRMYINHTRRSRHPPVSRLITFERWLSAYDANLSLICALSRGMQTSPTRACHNEYWHLWSCERNDRDRSSRTISVVCPTTSL